MKATNISYAKRSTIRNRLEELLSALTRLVATVSIQVVGAEAIGQRISGTSAEAGGRHQDLRCHESCTRVEEPCVIRHIKVVVLPTENVRSPGFSPLPQAVFQRVRTRTMEIRTTQT